MTHWSAIQLAAAGAAMLDARAPGWFSRIDTNQLDISDRCTCAVAQLFENNYQLGVSELKLSDDEQVANGVWVNEQNSNLRRSRYRCLTRAWRLEIERRLAAQNDNTLSEQDSSQIELPLAA